MFVFQPNAPVPSLLLAEALGQLGPVAVEFSEAGQRAKVGDAARKCKVVFHGSLSEREGPAVTGPGFLVDGSQVRASGLGGRVRAGPNVLHALGRVAP